MGCNNAHYGSMGKYGLGGRKDVSWTAQGNNTVQRITLGAYSWAGIGSAEL